jgi:hypothetical protein
LDPLGETRVKEQVFEAEPDAYNITQVELADLDGDGQRDLVVASIFDWVRVLRGRGDGTFDDGGRLTETGDAYELPQGCSGTVPCASAFREVTLVDLDEDGDLDVVTAGRGLRVFRNDGALVFTLAALSGSLGDEHTTYAMVAASAWRDGDLARIVATGDWDFGDSVTGQPPTEGSIFALASSDMANWSVSGSATFNLQESTPRIVRVTTGFAGDAIACGTQGRVVDLDSAGAIELGDTLDYCPRLFGDVDGDGIADMAPGGLGVGFVFGDGAGGYVQNDLSMTGPVGRGGTLGDINGDGDFEIIGL